MHINVGWEIDHLKSKLCKNSFSMCSLVALCLSFLFVQYFNNDYKRQRNTLWKL